MQDLPVKAFQMKQINEIEPTARMFSLQLKLTDCKEAGGLEQTVPQYQCTRRPNRIPEGSPEGLWEGQGIQIISAWRHLLQTSMVIQNIIPLPPPQNIKCNWAIIASAGFSKL